MAPDNRQARRRDARAEKARTKRRSIIFPVVILGLVVVGGALVALTRSNPPSVTEPPEGVREYENLSRDHVNGPVQYDVIPPAGGPHAATPLSCGFYSQPVPTENAVHSLEHGAIWITYEADLPEDQIGTLRRMAGPKVLVSPWPGELPRPIVASAWERQLGVESADDDRLGQFINSFRDGDQAPEPFAACSGVGQPQ